MKKIFTLTTLLALLSMGAHAESIKPYLYLGVGNQDLEGINGNSLSLIAGARAYSDSGLFIGAEAEFSLLKTEAEFNYFDSAASYDFETHEKVEAKYSVALNIPIGYRFNVNDKISIEPYGLIGYSVTKIDDRQYESKSTDNYSSSDLVYVGKFYGDGIKFGGGVDMTYDQNIKLGIRWTQANISGENLDEIKDKNLSMIVGYQF